MGVFRIFLEETDLGDSPLKEMQVRRIGAVRKQGKLSPLFYDYFRGKYLLGKVVGVHPETKTFFSPHQIKVSKELGTLEEITNSGFEIAYLGTVLGPSMI